MENAAVGAELIRAEIAKYTLAEIKEKLTGMRGQWAIVQDTHGDRRRPAGDRQRLPAAARVRRLPVQAGRDPVQFDEEPTMPGKSPDFNEHGDQILTEMLGLDWDTIIDLKVKGVVA